MSGDELNARLLSLEERLAEVRESVAKIEGFLCTSKDITSALRDPSTLIVVVTVLAASAGGQSIQQALLALTQTP